MARPLSHQTSARLDRRQFLKRLSLGLSGLGALLLALPVLGYLLAPLLRRTPETWQPVGAADQFEIGETVQIVFADASSLSWSGATAQTAAWLRRDGAGQFSAFAVNCTHLGCPVSWLPGASLFMCPCHGGVYYQDGSVAAGPPPHPLRQYPVRVQSGQVEIQTSAQPLAQRAGAQA